MKWLTSLLLLTTFCCLVVSLPDRTKKDRGDFQNEKALLIRDTRDLWRRLTFADDCSGVGSHCSSLKVCCEGLKCQYQTYMPPQGYCTP